MAYASDSGRKVKLQANAAMVALRYITKKLELYYKMVGWDTANLIKQYYTANQVLRIADESVGERWVEMNKPIMLPNRYGEPEPVYDEDIDPASGEPNEFYLCFFDLEGYEPSIVAAKEKEFRIKFKKDIL